MLKKQGIDLVRPLLGGLDGWKGRGFPVATVNRGAEPTDGAAVRTVISR